MRSRVLGFFSLFVLFAFAMVSVPVLAQSIQGSILGTVTDPTGAVIPGATIKITDMGTGITQTVTADAHGSYQLLNLRADTYQEEVSAPGFQTETLSNLVLTARQVLRVDAKLKPGQVSQKVEVYAGNAGVITTDTPSVHSSLTAKDVLNLPANYRASSSGTSPLSMIQTLPGVQANGGSFSVQGGQPFQSNVSVDGITVVNASNNGPMADALPSGDSIAEMRVDGVINSAQYGQPGQVTIVSKSGTNHLHGSLFWYHQATDMDATPYGSLTRPKVNTNDYGVSAGGPVYIPHLYNGHNRTFFYATYEGYRGPRESSVQYSVPTTAMKAGNFSGVTGVQPLSDPFTGGIYPNYTVPINPVAQKFLQFFPDPNLGDTSTYSPGTINYTANKDDSLFSKQFDVRIDQYFSQRAWVFGRFTWKNNNQDSPQVLNVPSSVNGTQDRGMVAGFNYTFTPNLLNQFRFGFTLQASGNTNPFNGKAFAEGSGLNGLQNLYYNGLPELDFNDLTSFDPDRLNSVNTSRTFVYNDDLSWTKGSHTMKFGVEVQKLSTITPLGFFGADNYGTFDFSEAKFTGQEFADFLIGTPDNTEYDAVQADNDGLALFYAAYAQDHWLVSPRLTLSYGIRWAYQPAYSDAHGDIGNFDPFIPKSGAVVYPDGHSDILSIPFLQSFNGCGIGQSSGVPEQNGAPCTPVLSNTQAGIPSGLKNSNKFRFFPRFGFAFRPFNNDKTSILGGFGIYNITLLGSNFYSLTGTLSANTVQYLNSVTPTGPKFVWPEIYAGSGSNSSAGAYGTAYFGTANDINWKQPYSEQVSLSVEHDMGHGFGGRVSYIGMMTRHLVWAPDLNLLPYSTTVSAYNQPLSARPFPNWGTIYSRSTGASADYQSMQAEFWHRSGGFTFDSTYTLAKNLSDDGGASNTGFAGAAGGPRASWMVPQVDFGQVGGTPRQRWLTTMVYALPVGRGQRFGGGMNRIANEIVGGWQFSGIMVAQTGPWVTPHFSGGTGDPSGTGSGLNGSYNGSLPGDTQYADVVGKAVPHNRNRFNWIQKSSFVCPGDPNWQPGERCYTGGGQSHMVNGVSTPDPAPIGRFGDVQNGSVEGPGLFNLSTGLVKSFRIREGISLRLEGTFTNVLNHTNLASPNTNISSAQFGEITSSISEDFGGARTGQISARLDF